MVPDRDMAGCFRKYLPLNYLSSQKLMAEYQNCPFWPLNQYGVILFQLDKSMSPWVGDFKIGFFNGFTIQFQEKVANYVFLHNVSFLVWNFTTSLWPKRVKFTKWPQKMSRQEIFY
jgi:hypothetical protein